MKHGILAFAILAATGTTALAGDTNPPIETPPITNNGISVAPSSGDWTGYYVGLQYATGELDDGVEDFDIDAFGIHGGYLYDLGSYVVGGELSFDSGELEGEDFDLDTETTRLKAIAGYDFGGFLPYVVVGVSSLDIEDVASDTGFVYGIGGSYQVSETFRVGAEYLVEEYDDFDVAETDFDVDVDTFEIRASFSF